MDHPRENASRKPIVEGAAVQGERDEGSTQRFGQSHQLLLEGKYGDVGQALGYPSQSTQGIARKTHGLCDLKRDVDEVMSGLEIRRLIEDSRLLQSNGQVDGYGGRFTADHHRARSQEQRDQDLVKSDLRHGTRKAESGHDKADGSVEKAGGELLVVSVVSQPRNRSTPGGRR